MTDALQIEVPAAVLELIVDKVTERVKAELDGASPWMTRQATAAYLDVPVSRLEKDRTVPMHRWDGRVFYHRDEITRWLLGQ